MGNDAPVTLLLLQRQLLLMVRFQLSTRSQTIDRIDVLYQLGRLALVIISDLKSRVRPLFTRLSDLLTICPPKTRARVCIYSLSIQPIINWSWLMLCQLPWQPKRAYYYKYLYQAPLVVDKICAAISLFGNLRTWLLSGLLLTSSSSSSSSLEPAVVAF